jgi:hypothetical protein
MQAGDSATHFLPTSLDLLTGTERRGKQEYVAGSLATFAMANYHSTIFGRISHRPPWSSTLKHLRAWLAALAMALHS